MSRKHTLKVAIKGHVYSLTTNEFGWGIVRMTERTDRFHKNYQVFRGDNGAPRSCTCPDWTRRNGVCKHMNAVLDVYFNQGKEEESRDESAHQGKD